MEGLQNTPWLIATKYLKEMYGTRRSINLNISSYGLDGFN